MALFGIIPVVNATVKAIVLPLAGLVAASCAATGPSNAVLRTVAEVTKALKSMPVGARFDITAKVLSPTFDRLEPVFLAKDETGTEILRLHKDRSPAGIRPGAILKMIGETVEFGYALAPIVATAKPIGYEPIPPPPEVEIADILDGKYNLRHVRVSGVVKDAFYDDIDPGYAFMILTKNHASMYVPIPLTRRGLNNIALPKIIGAEVSINGIVQDEKSGRRQYAGATLLIDGFDDVRMRHGDDSATPELEDVHGMRPDRISTLGPRRTTGRVVAVWKGDRFLLQKDSGEMLRIELVDGTPPPDCGATVEATGFPETDLFNVNLSRAKWRPVPPSGAPHGQETPMEVTAEMLLSKTNNLNVITYLNFGSIVSIDGVVKSLPATGNNDGRMLLECGNYMLPVDASSRPETFDGLAVGCHARVTGAFVFEADNWRANAIFPKITDIAIVVRRPEDVVVLSRPSWWTPFRLLVVIGVLSVAIAVMLLWNASLRILAERRGRALYRARIAKAASELRVDERTRLATELHDYVAQDMTAISYQVTAAKLAHETDSAACAQHLETAERMLGSCRTELRRCLWDLRNEALDERDVAKAVKTSIGPIVGDEAVSIKMDVPRSSLDDSTMHAMLSIVRELTANAVKHGHADLISIKGEVRDGRLILTVADDGAGFDPATSPGAAQGHFGLAGACERALQHGGDVSVESKPGKGTRITVSLELTPNMTAGS